MSNETRVEWVGFRVYYRAAGYLSETRVEARDKAHAMQIVSARPGVLAVTKVARDWE
jgi:hypothetical protein